MRTFGLIASALLPWLALAEEHRLDYTFQKDVNGHHIAVVLKLKSFDPKQHHLEKKNGIAYVDGAIPIGTDNTFSASTEFSQFEVRWDGKPMGIPKSYRANAEKRCSGVRDTAWRKNRWEEQEE